MLRIQSTKPINCFMCQRKFPTNYFCSKHDAFTAHIIVSVNHFNNNDFYHVKTQLMTMFCVFRIITSFRNIIRILHDNNDNWEMCYCYNGKLMVFFLWIIKNWFINYRKLWLDECKFNIYRYLFLNIINIKESMNLYLIPKTMRKISAVWVYYKNSCFTYIRYRCRRFSRCYFSILPLIVFTSFFVFRALLFLLSNFVVFCVLKYRFSKTMFSCFVCSFDLYFLCCLFCLFA